jgi:hypothetical protein
MSTAQRLLIEAGWAGDTRVRLQESATGRRSARTRVRHSMTTQVSPFRKKSELIFLTESSAGRSADGGEHRPIAVERSGCESGTQNKRERYFKLLPRSRTVIYTYLNQSSPRKARCWREAKRESSWSDACTDLWRRQPTDSTLARNSRCNAIGGRRSGKPRSCVMLIDAIPVVCFADFRKYFFPRALPTSQFRNTGSRTSLVSRTLNMWFW